MARARAKALPPGFRFHPTDVELVLYYLKRKVLGKRLLMDCIAELDMYKFSPWDLPDNSCLQSKDLEWYFFCPKDRKYANGVRINRATETGYWKATGRDRPICNAAETVGMKKTLVFHLGKTHRGERTNWVMHEYRLEIKDWNEAGVSQDSYVLCKLFEKSGVGPKNGEQHGAPFREEEWDTDLEEDSLVSLPHHVESGFPSIIPDDGKNAVSEDITLDIENSCQSSLLPDENLSSDPRDEILSLLEEVDMESLLAILGGENDLCPTGNDSNEVPELLNCERNIEAPPLSDANDIYGGLDDLSTRSKPKAIDNLGHTNIDDSGIDGMDYIELNDIDDLMKYPVKGDGPNKYPWEVNPENVPSGDQFKCNYETGLEGLSIPYISSGTLHPASDVGSSGCMDLESYGMLPYNLDLASDATALGFGIGSSGSMLPNYSGVSDHSDIEDSGVLRQTLLGDGIDYMELSDFDCLVKYPMEGNGPEKYPMGTESCNFHDWGPI